MSGEDQMLHQFRPLMPGSGITRLPATAAVWLIVISLTALASDSARVAIAPFVIHNADSSSLQLNFAAQLQMHYEEQDDGVFVNLRRLRPAFSVSMLDDRLKLKLQLSLLPGSSELIDLFADYHDRAGVSFRIGQSKIPFTRYRMQSYQKLDFVDWAITSTYFGAERQLGLSIHSGLENPSRLSWALGIFDGQNARSSHAVGIERYYTAHIKGTSDLATGYPREAFRSEFCAHLGYCSNMMSSENPYNEEPHYLRYYLAISGTWKAEEDEYRQFTARLAPEAFLEYRDISLLGIVYLGWADILERFESNPAMVGVLAEAVYNTDAQIEMGLRYANVEIQDDFVEARDATVGERPPYSVTSFRGEREVAVSLNFHILDHSLAWHNDLSWRKMKLVEITQTEFLFRSQLQVAF
jgi:hypothetical protein